MRELLERWSRLEPERCGISEHAAHLGKSFAFRIHWAVLGADPINLAVVLAAVIEAIEERGGSWELRGSGCPASARVTLNGATHGCIADEPTDPPAFALLGAYLRALEAER